MNAYSYTFPIDLPRLSTIDGKPITDNYHDPLDVTQVYQDMVDPEFDGEALAYFNLHGSCRDEVQPSLVALEFIEEDQPVFRTDKYVRAWWGPKFASELEATASAVLA